MEFGFGLPLYPTQRGIIEAATGIIKDRKVGVISSPTGSGKTLALLCSVMPYLTERNEETELFDLLGSHRRTKVYYCSRTHTQLNQVLRELRTSAKNISSVILGSRKQYCVNREVARIRDPELLSEKCRESVQDGACPYHGGAGYHGNEVMDIEELKGAGARHGFCPYYYTRDQAERTELVLMPYNILFTAEGRRSFGIELEDKILIVDEAHNLYDAIVQLNSAEVPWSSLARMAAARGVTGSLATILERLTEFRRRIKAEAAVGVTEFLLDSRLSSFNMFDVEDFVGQSRLAQRNDMPLFFELGRLLRLLTFSDTSGRVIYNQTSIRFTPLDPAMYFRDISKCRAVILAGGTMEPIDQLAQIFPGLAYHSFPAVSTNYLASIVPRYSSGRTASLSFDAREQQIPDLISTLIALSSPVLSGGILFFLPSRAVLALIRSDPRTSHFRRPVHFEGDIELDEFARRPDILFAVMGGRLSEGVNFADELCRLLVVVGVPYPTKSLELAERTKACRSYAAISAMKAVNQAVGRALRHRDDYASIVLLDSRYLSMRGMLSPWVAKSVKVRGAVDAMVETSRFLREAGMRKSGNAQ